MRLLATVALIGIACSFGCGEPDEPLHTVEPAEPPSAEPPAAEPSGEAITWPELPAELSSDLRRCVDDYRAIASQGLPAQDEGQAFDAWYAGPFQTWTRRYNDVRGRCDETFSAEDAQSSTAQAVLATQSYMHERLSEEATPHEREAQMFLMSRYWALGAACTYQTCGRGPAGAWAELCARRARSLPPCPPVEPAEAAPPPAPAPRPRASE